MLGGVRLIDALHQVEEVPSYPWFLSVSQLFPLKKQNYAQHRVVWTSGFVKNPKHFRRYYHI